MKIPNKYWITISIAVISTGFIGCGKQGGTSASDRTANALASYVPPGQKDEYYLRTQATYHASPNPTVQQLTALYRNISITIEFGRRLDKMHKSGSSDLESELNQMEQAGKGGKLVETAAVYPVLQSIVADTKVSAAARQKAQAILSMATAPAPAKP